MRASIMQRFLFMISFDFYLIYNLKVNLCANRFLNALLNTGNESRYMYSVGRLFGRSERKTFNFAVLLDTFALQLRHEKKIIIENSDNIHIII